MLLRIIFLLLLAGGIVGYIISQQSFNSNTQETYKNVKESGKAITYRHAFRAGHITIFAEMAEISNDEMIVLKNVKSKLIEKGKEVKINCGKCVLKTKQKQANLTDNVTIRTDDSVCKTSEALVNFKDQTITGSSKIFGVQNGAKFEAQGFSISQNGKIILKKAKMSRDVKKKYSNRKRK